MSKVMLAEDGGDIAIRVRNLHKSFKLKKASS